MSDRLFLYTALRPDGMNNQLQSIAIGATAARALNRTWVTPYLYENMQYTHRTTLEKTKMGRFDLFFNVTTLSLFVDSITWEDFLVACNGSVDYAHGNEQAWFEPEQLLGLRNFDNNISMPCNHETLSRQPYASAKCIALSHTFHMNSCNYGDVGRWTSNEWTGFDPWYPPYRDFLASLVPVDTILETAHRFMSSGNYAALHVRRGDFLSRCLGPDIYHVDVNVCPTIHHLASCIRNIRRHRNIQHCFIASDDDDQAGIISQLASIGIQNVSAFTSSDDVELRSLTQQTISVFADIFVGNPKSTWSTTVWQRRVVAGKASTYTLRECLGVTFLENVTAVGH